jgi:tetratricopeptide (TPR) repeat protein
MRTHDQRRPPLPAGLTRAEREFFLELRRLVDVAGFSCRALEESTSSLKSAAGDSCFYSKSQWGRWLNAQSMPPRNAVLRLAEILTLEDIAAEHLLDLWSRTFMSVSPEEAEQDDSRPTCPRQLPAATPQFIGRTAELTILAALADLVTENNGTVVIVIAGTAGTGKTALANHFGHRVCDRFPDGQLHVNLRGFDQAGRPMSAGAALRGFLEALGIPPKSIPVAQDDQVSLYRSLVADKNLLIILDNAHNVEQVRLLIPGSPGCMVVVTSRNELIGLVAEGAHAVRLAPFTLDDALELLTRRLAPGRRVEHEPQAATELVELCARLPLALSVAAARAAAHPNFPLAALVSEMRKRGLDQLDTGDPATTTRTVFSWSYHHLSDPAARMFRLLGIHLGPDMSVPAVASISAISNGQAHKVLLELAHAHLLEEHLPGRFTCHDLLRAYAAELARAHDTDADLQAAELRLLDHYLRTGHPGALLLAPMRECGKLPPPRPGVVPEDIATEDEAMAWFTAEHHVLLATAAHAAHCGFDTYCWQVTWTIAPYLVICGYWHDFASISRIALAAAQRLCDPVSLGYMYHQLSYASDLLGDTETAESHARQALAIFTRLGHQVGQATCLHALGEILWRQGRCEEALPLECEALQLRRAHGSPAAVVSSENALGGLYARLGDYDTALQHCRRSLEMQEAAGSRWYASETLSTIGFAYSRIGDHAQAIVHYEQAVAISRELGDLPSLASTLERLRDAHFAAGDLAAADSSWQQALKVLDTIAPQDAQTVRTMLSRNRNNA